MKKNEKTIMRIQSDWTAEGLKQIMDASVAKGKSKENVALIMAAYISSVSTKCNTQLASFCKSAKVNPNIIDSQYLEIMLDVFAHNFETLGQMMRYTIETYKNK